MSRNQVTKVGNLARTFLHVGRCKSLETLVPEQEEASAPKGPTGPLGCPSQGDPEGPPPAQPPHSLSQRQETHGRGLVSACFLREVSQTPGTLVGTHVYTHRAHAHTHTHRWGRTVARPSSVHSGRQSRWTPDTYTVLAKVSLLTGCLVCTF